MYFESYLFIVTANHFPKRHLVTETVCGLIRIQRLAVEVRHWDLCRGGEGGSRFLGRPVKERL